MKDHLGNGRVYFSDMNKDGIVEVAQNGNPNELLQQEHYYPFGMGIKGEWKFVQPQIGGVNAYQYNGKELNEDFGLNWNDYGARWYDASIGRWNGVDPLAEDYSSWSGYNYVLGNPIKSIDPDGMRVIINYTESITKKNGKVVEKQRKHIYKAGEEYTGNNSDVRETVEAMNHIIEKKLDYVFEEEKGVVEEVANDKSMTMNIHIKGSIGKGATYSKAANAMAFNPKEGVKAVDNDGKETGVLISPMSALLHEFGHAYRHNYKTEEAKKDYLTPDVNYTNKEEKWVIEKVDNEAALRQGLKKGTRYNHGGIPYKTKGVFSTEEVPE